MTQYDILSDGAAMASIADEPNDDQLPVHGVLFGTGDVTTGLSGKRTRWPDDVLEAMVDDGVFEGKPFTLADSLDPEQHVGVEKTSDGPQLTGPVSMDEKVGEITSTAFDPDVGVLYEGFLADWEAEDAVTSGLAQISPVVVRDLDLVEGEEGSEDAVYEVSEVSGARDVALVADGAVPSNEIEVGESPEGLGESEVAEALSAHYDIPLEALTPASSGAGGDAGSGDDDPDDGMGQSTPGQDSDDSGSGWRQSMTNDELTDKEREILAAAGQKDDPTVVESDTLADIEALQDEYGELIETASDLEDPAVTEADSLEAMNSRLSTVESMFDEALVDERGLKESTVEAMSFEAKASEFENDEGDLDVEALTQSPETGTTPSGGDGGGGDVDLEALSSDERSEVDSLLSRAETFDNVSPEHAESLRGEAAEIAGAEDAEELIEVL